MSQSNGRLILEQVYWREQTHPNKNYFVQPIGNGEVKNYSWADVVREAKTMATYLKSLNYPEKSNIALISKNCASWIIADLAIWMAGHVSVPLYPTLNAETVRQILEHSEAKLLFVGKLDTWQEMKGGVPEGLPMIATPLSPKNHGLPTWEGVTKGLKPIEGNPTRDADELATIVYTSGSTGQPKGVMLSFYALSESSSRVVDLLMTTDTDRMISYLPLAHVFERLVVETHSIYSGIEIFFAESLDTFIQDLQRAKPTLFVSVPRLWLKFQQGVIAKMPQEKLNKLLKIPILNKIIKKKILTKLGLQHVRFAGTGSAPTPPPLISWYNDLGLELLEGYGMSENFAYSHISRPGQSKVGYVGNAMPGVEHRISDQGEILVKSSGNTMGYYKAPELTKELFTEDGFVQTGDRGEIDSEGRLRITGRVKELFKTSKGKYVAPAPIENKILATNLAEQTCVSGSGQPSPYALIVLPEETRAKLDKNQIDKDTIASELTSSLKTINSQLDHHEQLQFMVIAKDAWTIENGFLTPTMKVKRGIVEDNFTPKAEGWYETKQQLIWE